MNPQSSSKPVMDVSAPRPTQPLATPPAKPAAPIESGDSQFSLGKVATKSPMPEVPDTPHPKSGAPVGVITVAVLMMMLLSAAAVIVYATSQTA